MILPTRPTPPFLSLLRGSTIDLSVSAVPFADENRSQAVLRSKGVSLGHF